MKVLLASDLFAPSLGGTERHVEDLARRLVGAGHEAVVATLTPGPDSTADGVPVRRVRGWSTRMIRRRASTEQVFHPPVADPEVVTALVRTGSDEGVDLVHGHGWMAHSAVPAAGHLSLPVVVSLHDYGLRCARMGLIRNDGSVCDGPSPLRCARCTAGAYGALRGPVVAAGLAASAGWLDTVGAVVANSEAVAADARRHGIDESRLHVAPPWLGARPVAGRSLGPDGPFIAYAGAATRAKGLDVLHAALADGGPAPLVVMGTRGEDVGDPPPGASVHRDVDHATVLATLAAAAVVVVPSRYPEPFGLVALEAMAAGTPVVGSRVGGLATVLASAGVGVAPGDPVALRSAIEAVLDDPTWAAHLREGGRRRAAELDGWPVLDRIYRDLLPGPWPGGYPQASPVSLRM